MTIPKKGRRSIHVDGNDYHWAVRFERSGHVVIQHASGQGGCVIIEPLDVMQPAHVADAIRYAIQRGWLPGERGPNVWLGFQASEPFFRRIPADSEIYYDNDNKCWSLPNADLTS